MSLFVFVEESNRIEGITRQPTEAEVEAHETILWKPELELTQIDWFVDVCTEGRGKLRDREGLNVVVGPHRPPSGGPAIKRELEFLLTEINQGKHTPWEAHVLYETLHPFTDGNGRSGRVIWAWMMERERQNPFLRPFLHTAYYQALEHTRQT